ncbi:hypothetical protein INT43_004604 [Umbelopsis isabellina]|uniref:Uncharacterized protein n=1 Tax=Mortierella isabellina TaxID=91625 RepID=A0A8H7PGF4_MORIS|nr:hypothetical protein INT43_004604 [Umbelopsis isabellina]
MSLPPETSRCTVNAATSYLCTISGLVILGVFSLGSNPVFAILGWVFAFILVFVEVPLCMKVYNGHCSVCCMILERNTYKFDVSYITISSVLPVLDCDDAFATRFENSYLRTLLYFVMAIVMFLSATISKTLLLLPACLLLFAAISYGIAAIKGQPHASSSALGGTGVDNVV